MYNPKGIISTNYQQFQLGDIQNSGEDYDDDDDDGDGGGVDGDGEEY